MQLTRLVVTRPFFLFFLCGLFLSKTAFAFRFQSFPEIPSGIWHGEIKRADGQHIDFNFETKKQNGKTVLYIRNGSDTLLVDQILQKKDSVWIDMPFFDSHFALRLVNHKKLEGSWIKINGEKRYTLPFTGTFGVENRYTNYASPAFNISGRWSVLFRGSRDSTESVGEFTQAGSRLTGTFLTSTGDYRFLEGIVSGDTLKMSTFDGGHAYYFQAKITSDYNISEGNYYSGEKSVESWRAVRNSMAKLPDEYDQTHLKNKENAILHFKFPDLQGRMVSLQDSIFQNKVVIVQILGSWCPNCMDETRFLAPWYIQNKSRGVAMVGLAYERTTSYSDAKRLLQPFVTRFNITYPILPTGVTVSDSLRTQKTLPEIQKIMGFPTTIFIDKTGKIRRIHTGFNGPGTGEHYDQFKKEFNELIDSMLSE